MANTTVLALFKDKRDADAAVRALQSAHFDSARLGVVSPGAHHYEEEVEAGRTLVTVDAEAGRANDARQILLQEGAFEASPLDTPHLKAS